MRPIANEQSFVRSPLNQLLSTAANVRLLRVLADEVVGPISAADAAARSGLTETGARRALRRLARTGFVKRVGGGRSQQYTLRSEESLTDILTTLFRMERERYEALLSGIRSCFRGLAEVRSAWIQALPESVEAPVEVAFVGDTDAVSWLGPELRTRMLDVERRFDVTIEIRGYTRTEAPDVDWGRATLVAGVPTDGASGSTRPVRAHSDHDARAARLSAAIAALLDENPSLTRRAVQHVRRLLGEDHGSASHDLREWLALLETYSTERLRRFLVSDSTRAQRLRQSSPFFAVLDASERDRVMAELERTS